MSAAGLSAYLQVLLLYLHVKLAKRFEPSRHSLHLVFILSLARTLVDITLRPFAEAGCDLLNAEHWVILVVSQQAAIVALVLARFCRRRHLTSVSWSSAWS